MNKQKYTIYLNNTSKIVLTGDYLPKKDLVKKVNKLLSSKRTAIFDTDTDMVFVNPLKIISIHISNINDKFKKEEDKELKEIDEIFEETEETVIEEDDEDYSESDIENDISDAFDELDLEDETDDLIAELETTNTIEDDDEEEQVLLDVKKISKDI